jgi:xanthine dehydrogenase accessory factor
MSIFKCVAGLLTGGENLVLATIVSRSGSAPRAVGSRMAVRRDGAIIGTIGGGILEARVQELAREVFHQRQAVLKKYVLTAQDASQMGMVCGGVVQVLVQFLDASRPANLELYRDLVASLGARRRAWLFTEMPTAVDVPGLAAQFLIKGDGTTDGTAAVGPGEPLAVQALINQASAGQPEVIDYQGQRYLVESLCHEGTVYIFGAGHVSQQVAPLASLVGFSVVVLDDRQEFANRERFPQADEVVVLGNFDEALAGIEINADSYLVIVTRGHAHDQTVLRQALATAAGYIGMIGSRRKRDAVYENLGKEGFTRQDFDRVFSPIGLAIGAETPEEIAVSIVAEVIQVRAGKNR